MTFASSVVWDEYAAIVWLYKISVVTRPTPIPIDLRYSVIFGNSLLSGIGPKIKIRLELLGDITSNIETEVKPYGINNAYIEMKIQLEVTARILLPFISEKVVISNVIPISMNIVEGTVPEAYISSYK